MKSALTQSTRVEPANQSVTGCTDAGLILVWPQLSSLFREFELLTEDEISFTSPEARLTAFHLLLYLVSGEDGTDISPSDLSLCAFLSDLIDDENGLPEYDEFFLSQFQKECCEVYLRAIAYKWKPLSNMPNIGLRQLFFQRNGWIDLSSDHCLLVVQSRAQDVALRKFPWDLHDIALPWLKRTIAVEWFVDLLPDR